MAIPNSAGTNEMGKVTAKRYKPKREIFFGVKA